MGAYAFAWMSFPGRNIFFIVIVALMVVPIQMTLIPILQLFQLMHINGTILAVWLAHSGYGLPFEVFLLRNYLGGLPREIFESAEVDGAGHSVRFLRIAVPMTIPAIASLTIFVFLGIWNDLLVALTFLGTSPYRPFTVKIAQLVTSSRRVAVPDRAAVLQMALRSRVHLPAALPVRGITSGSVRAGARTKDRISSMAAHDVVVMTTHDIGRHLHYGARGQARASTRLPQRCSPGLLHGAAVRPQPREPGDRALRTTTASSAWPITASTGSSTCPMRRRCSAPQGAGPTSSAGSTCRCIRRRSGSPASRASHRARLSGSCCSVTPAYT
jgi:hypothetical protein